MNFLIDAQLPPALARLITSLDHYAVHVEEAKLLLATDETIWDYARKHQLIIITKDEDFKNMLLLTTTSRTPVVWVRIGNCSNAELTRMISVLIRSPGWGGFFMVISRANAVAATWGAQRCAASRRVRLTREPSGADFKRHVNNRNTDARFPDFS